MMRFITKWMNIVLAAAFVNYAGQTVLGGTVAGMICSFVYVVIVCLLWDYAFKEASGE